MFEFIQKLSTAARGSTREVLEGAVDAQSLRILSQEIYECEASLKESKLHLANVVAEKLSIKRKLDGQKNRVANKEQEIRDRLEQDDEASALLLAEELAQLETWVNTQQQQHDQLQDYETNLLQALKRTAFTLSKYRNELNMARAVEETQKSVGKLSVHANKHSDKFSRMQESLDRIKLKHENFDDKMLAMQNIESHIRGEPSSQEINKKRAEEVLARFKKSVD